MENIELILLIPTVVDADVIYKCINSQAIRDGGGRANNTRDGPPLLMGALPHPRSPSAILLQQLNAGFFSNRLYQ
jgi:hypothetical protein